MFLFAKSLLNLCLEWPTPTSHYEEKQGLIQRLPLNLFPRSGVRGRPRCGRPQREQWWSNSTPFMSERVTAEQKPHKDQQCVESTIWSNMMRVSWMMFFKVKMHDTSAKNVVTPDTWCYHLYCMASCWTHVVSVILIKFWLILNWFMLVNPHLANLVPLI